MSDWESWGSQKMRRIKCKDREESLSGEGLEGEVVEVFELLIWFDN
jgi:hypothetical protein